MHIWTTLQRPCRRPQLRRLCYKPVFLCIFKNGSLCELCITLMCVIIHYCVWKLCDWPTFSNSLEVLDIEDIVVKPCSRFLHINLQSAQSTHTESQPAENNSQLQSEIMNNYFHFCPLLPAAPLLATPKIPICLHIRHNDGLYFTGNCKRW